MRTRFLISLVLAILLTALPLASAGADGEGEVTGTVTLNGQPLAGVEVFLAAGKALYTCTDENGEFEFADVDEFFYAATGPAVALDCENAKFVDDEGNPLQVAIDDDGGWAGATVDFNVEPLPEDHRGTFNRLSLALGNCYDGNGAAAADILADFEVPEKLAPELAEIYLSYAGTLRFVAQTVCPQDPVTVVGLWAEDAPEALALRVEFDAFTADKGVEVSYENAGGVPDIEERIFSAEPPDVIMVPQPGFLRDVAGELADLSSFVAEEDLRADFGDYLIDAVVQGAVLGAPASAFLKTLVWYKPAEFDAHGYEIPETFDELVALSDEMVGDELTPWCNYIGSGAATGWVGTDWIEDLLLGAAGSGVYDQWIDHTVPFSDPTVEAAFARYQAMIDTPGYVYERPNMLDVFFGENVWPLYEGDCLMHRQATFFRFFMPEGIAGEFSTFKFPSVDPDLHAAAMGGTDYVAALNDGTSTESLIQFMLSPTFGEAALAGTGGWMSPNSRFDGGFYPTDLVRDWSDILQEAIAADLFRPDASDLMPPQVGAGSFWTGVNELVAGLKTIDQVLGDIDASWPD